jgi:signal transduction histidine kinase
MAARMILKAEQGRTDVCTLDERLERQRLTFEAIFRLVEKLGTTFDVSKIASLFLMTLMGQLKVRRVSLYIVVPESGRLEPYRSLGVADGASLRSVACESGFVRWLADANGPMRVDDYAVGTGSSSDHDDAAILALSEKGFFRAIALGEQGSVLGALFYGDTVTGEPLTTFDDEIVKMLARVASITLKNAFLYQTAIASKVDLEQFAAVKHDFISHTSHELRTPLTVLKSALWSLEPDQVDEEVLVDMARDAITRLEGKVDYLLSLNDIELNRTDFSFAQTEASSIVEDVLREMIPELEEKQVHVDIDDRARFSTVFADEAKIKIAVRSILDNALRSVGRGGNISITLRVSDAPPGPEDGEAIGDWRSNGAGFDSCIAGGGRVGSGDDAGPGAGSGRRTVDPGSYFVIGVKDDGIGIPSSEIKTLAEPFTMASNSTNRNVEGLGIGLSVSQKLVAGHGGKILCRSELGSGAEFSIWLPLGA